MYILCMVEIIKFVSSRLKLCYSLAIDPPIIGLLSRQTEKGYSCNLHRRSFQRLTRKTSVTHTCQREAKTLRLLYKLIEYLYLLYSILNI